MTTPRLERRRFQFGLRKLLLWTAAIALVLGMAATLGTWAWIPAGWIIVVGIVRWCFGAKVAGMLSIGAAGTLLGMLTYVMFPCKDPGPDPTEAALLALFVGGLLGLATFGIAEGLVRAVNWADKVLETKGDGETRGD